MSDQARFDAAFREHHDAVLRFLTRRTDRSVAEDLLADTFLVAWRKRNQVPDDPLPWLYAVARNVVANHYRSTDRANALREQIEHRERSRPQGGEDIAPGPPDETALAAAMRKLRPDDQEVLMLHAWEDLDRNAAARVLGCRPATYSVRLHRARGRLRSALRDTPATAPGTLLEHAAPTSRGHVR